MVQLSGFKEQRGEEVTVIIGLYMQDIPGVYTFFDCSYTKTGVYYTKL